MFVLIAAAFVGAIFGALAFGLPGVFVGATVGTLLASFHFMMQE